MKTIPLHRMLYEEVPEYRKQCCFGGILQINPVLVQTELKSILKPGFICMQWSRLPEELAAEQGGRKPSNALRLLYVVVVNAKVFLDGPDEFAAVSVESIEDDPEEKEGAEPIEKRTIQGSMTLRVQDVLALRNAAADIERKLTEERENGYLRIPKSAEDENKDLLAAGNSQGRMDEEIKAAEKRNMEENEYAKETTEVTDFCKLIDLLWIVLSGGHDDAKSTVSLRLESKAPASRREALEAKIRCNFKTLRLLRSTFQAPFGGCVATHKQLCNFIAFCLSRRS